MTLFHRFIGFILISLSAWLVFSHIHTGPSTNAESRLATIESLVDFGSFKINQSRFHATLDKAKIGNDFVSEKPPLFSFIGAGVYFVLQKLTGWTIAQNLDRVLWWLTLILVWIPYLISFLVFERWIWSGTRKPTYYLVALLTFGFATLYPGYVTVLNNHAVAGALLLIGFYQLRLAISSTKTYHWWASGLLLGLAPTIDLPAAIPCTVFGLQALVNNPSKTLKSFLPFAIIPISAHFLLNYIATGFWLPLYFRYDLIAYPGSFWENALGIDALTHSKFEYLFHITFGFRGVFSLTPVFLFSLVALGLVVTRKILIGRKEIWAILSATFLLFGFYTLFATNKYGGLAVGYRFMIMMAPLLAYASIQGLVELRSRWAPWIFGIFLITSSFNAYNAWTNPWRTGQFENALRDTGWINLPKN